MTNPGPSTERREDGAPAPVAALSAFSFAGLRRLVRTSIQQNPAGVIGILAIFLLALVWLSVGTEIAQDRTLTIKNAFQDNAVVTHAFEEHAARTLSNTEQTMLFIKHFYEQQPANVRIADYTQLGLIDVRIFDHLGIINERGAYVQSDDAKAMVINVSGEEYFTTHVSGKAFSLYIGKPERNAITGSLSLHVSVRIKKPDGSFGGIVLGAINPYYFHQLYKDLELSKDSVIAVIGLDGIIRVRKSGADTSAGQDISKTGLYRKYLDTVQGEFLAPAPVDGEMRLYSYRRMSDYPFFVSIGRSEKEILAPYRERRSSRILWGFAASALILLFSISSVLLIRLVERSRAEAEAANRMKSEFLANMSHELRTPLNGILGFAELLTRRLTDEKEKKFATMIHTSGKHLLGLVNTILDMARIEAGKMVVEFTSQPLQSIIDECLGLYQAEALRKQLALVQENHDDVPTTIQGDRMRIVQILNNLISNAIKFTEHGQVCVRAREEGDFALIEVVDSGPGIPLEAQSRIFSRFTQADASVTRQYGGTGLGLALSFELAQLMNGRLSFVSVPGKGSTFTLRLPCHAQPSGKSA